MHSSGTLSHFHPEDARGDVFECRGAVTRPLPALLSLDVGLLVSGAPDGPQRLLVAPLSRAQAQRIGHRRTDSAAGLFNITAQLFCTPPPFFFFFCGSGHAPWPLPLSEPTAYNLPGFPPIPPQLILWDAIVMQIEDA